MAGKYDEDYPNDEKAAVNYRSPLERMLDMKDEQIGVLRQDLARKENQMAQREKETREALLSKDKEWRDTLVKKDQEWRDMLAKKDQEWMDESKRREKNWMEKVEELKGQLGRKDHEVHKCDLNLASSPRPRLPKLRIGEGLV